uniref:WGS project CBME000000000 data, contig CS3487_c001662 n=1 Tax=Fusarium pseudograminearum CS3487 TaxID=1318458 RepID=A0A096PEH1_FUSPS|nr:unnamed protein product [Fusarium pseudograminearum CS3487]
MALNDEEDLVEGDSDDEDENAISSNLAPGFWFWGRADPHLVPGEHLSLDVVEPKCERKVASTMDRRMLD